MGTHVMHLFNRSPYLSVPDTYTMATEAHMSTAISTQVLSFNHRTASREDLEEFLRDNNVTAAVYANMNTNTLRLYVGRKRRRLLKMHTQATDEAYDVMSLWHRERQTSAVGLSQTA